MADDQSIDDDCKLYRRIPNVQIVYDENLGCPRPSSQAFEDHPDGSPMSIVIDDTLSESGLTPESVLIDHEDFSLVSFTAGYARSLGLEIERDPRPGNPGHGHVIGKKTTGKKRGLARTCEWVINTKK